MRKYFLILVMVLFSGCSMNHHHKGQKLTDLPGWYLSPTQNDYDNLYGIGEGYTLEEATKSALSDAAARLSLTISSDSDLLIQENNHDASEEFRKSIRQNVEKIDFANFEVSQSQKFDEKIYVEVKIDRSEFVKLQKEKITFLDNQINNLRHDLHHQNIVKKRNSLVEILDLARQSEILTRIVYSSKSGELREKLKVISDVKRELSRLNNKFEFYFVNKSSKKIFNVIKNAANKERIDIAIKEKESNDQIKIRIKSSKRVSKIYGSYITKITIWFDNISRDKVIASNSIEVSGSSVLGVNQSYDAAIASLKEKVEDDGVLKILGVI